MVLPVLVLPACKKKEAAKPPAATPTAQALPVAAATKVAPVQKQQSSAKNDQAVQLDFKTKKDPFKALITDEKAKKPQPQAARKVTNADLLPIQSYDVTKFKISGIIIGLKENKALIVDPGGKGYVVKEGMLIGNNEGKISRITANSIEVIEQYRDSSGRVRAQKIVLTLTTKKKEKP
jgi:type IV pilus assembly protein PilP